AAPYVIFGAKVPPHWLAIGTILTVVGGIYGPKAFSSPAAAAPAATPAAAPSSEPELDVEKAINDFLASDKKE
uniref:ATP synthase subunit L n=1 Tax=Pichia angusta TaxID=870730 RepID=ATPLN_PICAN|nr:RecName: Full=ATP synthase subunit L [Ogataea angusta]